MTACYARLYRELQGVAGSARGDELIDRQGQPPRLSPFLQRRLRVARRPRHVVEQGLPEAADKSGRRLETAV